MRLAIDATSVSPDGKGIARVQRGIVDALAARGEHELVVFVRHPEALALFAAHPLTCELVRPPLTLWWEQHGLPRPPGATRSTRRSRGRSGFRSSRRRAAASSSGSTRCRITGSSRTGPSGPRPISVASDLVTRLVWRRSLRRAAWIFTGSRRDRGGARRARAGAARQDAAALRRRRPVVRPGRGACEPALPLPPRLLRPAGQHRDRARRLSPAEDAPPLVVAGGLGARRAELERAGAGRRRLPRARLRRRSSSGSTRERPPSSTPRSTRASATRLSRR